jgi:hypothetical protein
MDGAILVKPNGGEPVVPQLLDVEAHGLGIHAQHKFVGAKLL